ncbi:MAG: hypothetical protein GXP31_03185 [Kiritimatiellaeota bacterium]|nr:hypothetical protein [Kiritimatiellota bacterium]
MSLKRSLAWVFFPSILLLGGIKAGSREFPIGIFSAGDPTEANFRYVKELGFDYVHRYGLASRDEKTVQAYMDMAGKTGLKVMLDISGPLRGLAAGKISDTRALAEVGAMLRRWKDHRALGFWYLYDEPNDAMPPETLMKFHALVKRETPHIPDAIAMAWIKNWDKWMQCADIIMPDFYPVRNEEFPKAMLNNQPIFFGAVGKRCDTMIPIVQCFGFPRYPNATELRYILFSTLPQKSSGLFFWSYWRSRFQPLSKHTKLQPDYLENTLKPILADFRQCVRRIGPVERVRFVPSLADKRYSSRQVLLGVWRKGGKTFIVLINNWPEERDLSIPLRPHVIDAGLRPICSTRPIPDLAAAGGTLQLHALPWETFIWETVERTDGAE